MEYPIIILSDQENLDDPGSHWYICFQDGEIMRYLPTTKKQGWFQKWTPEKCPLVRVGESKPENVLRFEDRQEDYNLTPENIQEVFEYRHDTVENYLVKINRTGDIVPMHHDGVIWDLRNIHGRCGQCNSLFSPAQSDVGEGICSFCSSHSR